MRTMPERLENGRLPGFAFPGGYPIAYLDRENSVLCADCATKSADDPDEVPQFKPVDYAIVEPVDDEDITHCDQCSKEIK